MWAHQSSCTLGHTLWQHDCACCFRACCSPASRLSSESENFADRLWSVGERDSQCQNTAVTDHRAAENCGDRSHSCRDWQIVPRIEHSDGSDPRESLGVWQGHRGMVPGATGTLLPCKLIEEEAKKRSVFFTHSGANTYKLLQNLIAPEKTNTKTYAKLVQVLANHYNLEDMLRDCHFLLSPSFWAVIPQKSLQYCTCSQTSCMARQRQPASSTTVSQVYPTR